MRNKKFVFLYAIVYPNLKFCRSIVLSQYSARTGTVFGTYKGRIRNTHWGDQITQMRC